jgi:hypothetical protein
MADDDSGFLSRWSRRKVQVRQGVVPAELPPPAAVVALEAPAAPGLVVAEVEPVDTAPPAPPSPTLADVTALGRDSDYTRFVAPGVDSSVKNAALKKLFSDPHFNLMDGLDTYIDDYGQPDPLPAGMLRQMVQAQVLGLFADDADAPAEGTAPAAAPLSPIPPAQARPDEDAALRLQPHDAAGPPGADGGTGPHAG